MSRVLVKVERKADDRLLTLDLGTGESRARAAILFLAGVLFGLLVLLAVAYLGGSEAEPLAEPLLTQRDEPAREAAQRVLEGGYILHVRHAERQKWPAVIAFDVFETETADDAARASYRDAVCLTPQGQEEAKMLGAIFDLANVPVSEVIASPSCRAQQTAQLAFGTVDRTEVALVHTPAFNVQNRPEFATALRDLYQSLDVDANRNVVIIAHGNTLENNPDLFGSGTEWLSTTLLGETGFYVIDRDEAGALSIMYRFNTLGDFAANAISLTP